METLRFILGLQDNVSGPASRIINYLRGIRTQLRGLRAGFNQLYGATSGLRNVSAGLAGVGVAGTAAGVAGMAKLAVSAGAFKQSTMTALEVMQKSEKAAINTFKESVKFASKTPFSTQTVLGAYKTLIQAEFGKKEIPVLLSAVSDMSSFDNFSEKAVQGILYGITQIKNAGNVQGDELNQLTNYGFSKTKFYDALAKKLNITKQEVKKLQEAGKISSDLGIWGILESVRVGVSGGKLGQLTEKASQNLLGLWSTLKSRPFEIFMSFNETKAFKSLTRIVKVLGAALDPESAGGKKTAGALNKLMDTVIGVVLEPLAKAVESGQLEKWIEKITVFLTKFGQMFKTYFPMAIEFIKGFASGFREVAQPVAAFIGKLIEMNGGGEQGAKKLGEMVGKLTALGVVLAWLLVPLKLLFQLGGVISRLVTWLRGLGPTLVAINVYWGRFVAFAIRLRRVVGALALALSRMSGAWGVVGRIMLAIGAPFRFIAAMFARLRGLVFMFSRAWGVLAFGLSGLPGILGIIGRAMMVFTGPIGILIGAIITGLVLLYKKNAWFKAFIDGVWDDIKDIFRGAMDFIVSQIMMLIGFLTGNKSMYQAGLNLFQSLLDGMKARFKDIAAYVSNVVKMLREKASSIIPSLKITNDVSNLTPAPAAPAPAPAAPPPAQSGLSVGNVVVNVPSTLNGNMSTEERNQALSEVENRANQGTMNALESFAQERGGL